MSTYTHGIYEATVCDDLHVEVRRNGVLFDRPGPWADHTAADEWAQLACAYYTIKDEREAQTQP